ncbi:MAG: hypothetical protein IPL78_31940 [Chloroflexi bacterium]|nr:hypothetical protein [Chloroflexota bacterium]
MTKPLWFWLVQVRDRKTALLLAVRLDPLVMPALKGRNPTPSPFAAAVIV